MSFRWPPTSSVTFYRHCVNSFKPHPWFGGKMRRKRKKIDRFKRKTKDKRELTRSLPAVCTRRKIQTIFPDIVQCKCFSQKSRHRLTSFVKNRKQNTQIVKLGNDKCRPLDLLHGLESTCLLHLLVPGATGRGSGLIQSKQSQKSWSNSAGQSASLESRWCFGLVPLFRQR